MARYLKGVSQLFQSPYQLVRANLIINLCKDLSYLFTQYFHFSSAVDPDLDSLEMLDPNPDSQFCIFPNIGLDISKVRVRYLQWAQ